LVLGAVRTRIALSRPNSSATKTYLATRIAMCLHPETPYGIQLQWRQLDKTEVVAYSTSFFWISSDAFFLYMTVQGLLLGARKVPTSWFSKGWVWTSASIHQLNSSVHSVVSASPGALRKNGKTTCSGTQMPRIPGRCRCFNCFRRVVFALDWF